VSDINLALCIGFLVLLVIDYRQNVYAKGRVVDLWTVTTFLSIIVPILLVGPTADAEMNALSIGDAVFDIPATIDQAAAICFVGIFFWYLGAVIFRRAGPIRKMLTGSIEGMAVALSPAYSRRCVELLFVVTLLGGMCINVLYGNADKSLRDVMLENASVRPWFNFFIISLAPLLLLISVSHYFDLRQKRFLFIGLLTAALCAFSGARGAFFMPLIWLYVVYKAKNPSGSPLRLLLLAGATALGGVAMGTLRSGGTLDGLSFALGYGIFYGNTFSDFRDLCWYLTTPEGADRSFYGATYLAGLMSFVPTYLSQFREQYNLGVITATAIGISPQEHAGIRITSFGEMYINFGFVGVALMSFVVSYLVKCFDHLLTTRSRHLPAYQLAIVLELAQIPLSGLGSSLIPAIYSFFLITALLRIANFCLKVRPRTPRPRHDHL
jgi:oligosaccharide repeat unit polymerase